MAVTVLETVVIVGTTNVSVLVTVLVQRTTGPGPKAAARGSRLECGKPML